MDFTTLATLNTQVNGTSVTNMTTALDAVTSRVDETTLSFCGSHCASTCEHCTTALSNLQAFYTNEPVEPLEAPAPAQTFHEVVEEAMLEQMTWENQVLAARALDEAEEAARSGMWADQNFDAHDNADLDDEEDFDYNNWDYDDRQDDYDDDWNTGLDWNDGGYFD